jgi:hypothetical protein
MEKEESTLLDRRLSMYVQKLISDLESSEGRDSSTNLCIAILFIIVLVFVIIINTIVVVVVVFKTQAFMEALPGRIRDTTAAAKIRFGIRVGIGLIQAISEVLEAFGGFLGGRDPEGRIGQEREPGGNALRGLVLGDGIVERFGEGRLVLPAQELLPQDGGVAMAAGWLEGRRIEEEEAGEEEAAGTSAEGARHCSVAAASPPPPSPSSSSSLCVFCNSATTLLQIHLLTERRRRSKKKKKKKKVKFEEEG